MADKLDLMFEDEDGGKTLTTSVSFNFNRLYYDGSDVVAMLSFTAPDHDIEKSRPPLNLVAAIDVSTSMAGQKLNTAKTSLVKLIEYLGQDDRLAVIAFGSDVRTVFESNFMNGSCKTAAQNAVRNLKVTGWTNLSGALMESFATMKRFEGKKGSINRVILFTDGEPTAGITAPDGILELLQKALTPQISISTFGYGKDYNEELLSEMSKRGNGNHYLVEDIERCAAMFGTELGGLLSTYAQNIHVEVTPTEGVQLLEFLDGYETQGNILTIPDILSGETKNVLVKLRTPKKTTSDLGTLNIVGFKATYDDLKEGRRINISETGSVELIRKADLSTEPNIVVQEQIDLLQAAKALEQARQLAQDGNIEEAKGVLSSAVRGLNISSVYAHNVGSELTWMADNLGSDMESMSKRMVATRHAYTTRRAAGTAADELFMNRNQTVLSTAMESDSDTSSSK